ncbi:MAG: hypothetical protein RIG68_12455 [Imperialibacter sp.]|uniref:hypothetical protein n=1 Tax=Imperialibacter sp. TaxID=2038411 RepID=UPI0032EC2ECE
MLNQAKLLRQEEDADTRTDRNKKHNREERLASDSFQGWRRIYSMFTTVAKKPTAVSPEVTAVSKNPTAVSKKVTAVTKKQTCATKNTPAVCSEVTAVTKKITALTKKVTQFSKKVTATTKEMTQFAKKMRATTKKMIQFTKKMTQFTKKVRVTTKIRGRGYLEGGYPPLGGGRRRFFRYFRLLWVYKLVGRLSRPEIG